MSRQRRYSHTDQEALSLVMIILAIYAAMIAFLVWAAKSIVDLIVWLISAGKKKRVPVTQPADSQPETTDRLIELASKENTLSEPALTESVSTLTESELLPAAIEVVVEAGMASTSLLQRRLKIGYAGAARLVDEMERMGIVGPFEGSKPRQVILSKERYFSLMDSGEFELNKNSPVLQSQNGME